MELQQRVSVKALKVWRLTGVIISLVFLLLAFILTILAHIFGWTEWIPYISWLSVILVCFLSIYLLPTLRWRWWRYEVRDEDIEIQKGIFIIKRTLVPMVRVQHVDTKQGPIMRKNNLATVEVSTAATVHEIPALDRQEAERLRIHIAKMVTMVKEDV